MKGHLKIKVKHLAARSRIIKDAERKYLKTARKLEARAIPAEGQRAMFESIYQDRKKDVQPKIRTAQLAYGFLKGRTYAQMENKIHEGNRPDWKRIEQMVYVYYDGEADVRVMFQKFAEWISDAKEHVGDG